MSALPPPGLLIGVMPPKRSNREKQIERFIREHPERYKKLTPAEKPREGVPVFEQFDRVRLGDVLGTYRRKKHTGSDDQ